MPSTSASHTQGDTSPVRSVASPQSSSPAIMRLATSKLSARKKIRLTTVKWNVIAMCTALLSGVPVLGSHVMNKKIAIVNAPTSSADDSSSESPHKLNANSIVPDN